LFKLNVFELIDKGINSSEKLAEEIGCNQALLRRLLRAGISIGLLESQHMEEYALSAMAQDTLISQNNQNYIGNGLKNLGFFQQAFFDIDNVIKEETPPHIKEDQLHANDGTITDFIKAMDDYANFQAADLADNLDTRAYDSLLDLGCGPGTYSFHLGKQNPRLSLYLADLPNVIKITKKVKAAYKLNNPVEFISTDVVKEPVEGKYDIILLSNILHMVGKTISANIIKQLYYNINEGGSIVIQGQFMADSLEKDTMAPLFLDMVLLSTTKTGENHSFAETNRWLESAGFTNISYVPMSIFNPCSYVKADKKS